MRLDLPANLTRIELGGNSASIGGVHVRIGHTSADCSHELGELGVRRTLRGRGLYSLRVCAVSHVGFCQSPTHRPRLRARRCMSSRIRIRGSLTQKDNDTPGDTSLAQVNVGLPDVSFEARIAQRVRDASTIATDFPLETAARASRDRPGACRCAGARSGRASPSGSASRQGSSCSSSSAAAPHRRPRTRPGARTPRGCGIG